MQLQHRPHSPNGCAYSAKLPSGVSVTVIVEPPSGGAAWAAQQAHIELLALQFIKSATKA